MTDKTRKKHIGKSLQKARKDAGYSSAEKYALHIKEKPDTYTGYEQGRISIPLEKLWKFADDLGISLDKIAGRQPPRASFPDPRQEQLNGCYESLNEESKTQVSEMVKSIAADPARRIEKEGQGREDLPGMEEIA